MPVFRAKLGEFRCPRGRWRPTGDLLWGERPNPVQQRWKVTYTGRLFIGHNVRGVATWTTADIVNFVKAQWWHGGASIIGQRGLWRPTQEAVAEEEDSSQVVVMDDHGKWTAPEAFADAVIALGEKARAHFRQYSVLFEVQANGVRYDGGEIVA